MKKKKTKHKTLNEMYSSFSVGFAYFLRGGAGIHTDRKKQKNKDGCKKQNWT